VASPAAGVVGEGAGVVAGAGRVPLTGRSPASSDDEQATSSHTQDTTTTDAWRSDRDGRMARARVGHRPPSVLVGRIPAGPTRGAPRVGNVPAVLLDRAETDGDGIALDDAVRTRTWAELLDRATRGAHLLRDGFGLAPGDHAAMVVGNRVEFVELVVAAQLAGVWLTPVNWHLTSEELAYVVEDSGARVVVTEPPFEAASRAAVDGRVPVVLVGGQLDAALADADDAPIDRHGPAGGTMLYTSGTTGRPKGVKRTTAASVERQFANQVAYGRAIGLDGGGPHLVTGPLYHAAPLGYAAMDLGNGAPLVIMDRWDASSALQLMADRGVRNSHFVPTMFVRLLRLPDEVRAGFDPRALHTVLHGAAPIAASVKRRMIEWWGPVLVEYWGGSEGGVVTLVGSDDWLAHPGTVGRAVRGHEVFAVGDDGTRLGPGETGTLYARNEAGSDVFAYHNDPDQTARAHLTPGTYTLGDVGRVDADGYVYLSDRASNTIISGGVNVYPAEIEAVLIGHPAVADVAVFGIPDDEWGERVKAAVELAPGVEPSERLGAELLAHAREHLAGYKVPRSVDFLASLPRTPAGKLLVRELRAPYWEGRDRAI
jgi:long-chain acyl-CoA synthetase